MPINCLLYLRFIRGAVLNVLQGRGQCFMLVNSVIVTNRHIEFLCVTVYSSLSFVEQVYSKKTSVDQCGKIFCRSMRKAKKMCAGS